MMITRNGMIGLAVVGLAGIAVLTFVPASTAAGDGAVTVKRAIYPVGDENKTGPTVQLVRRYYYGGPGWGYGYYRPRPYVYAPPPVVNYGYSYPAYGYGYGYPAYGVGPGYGYGYPAPGIGYGYYGPRVGVGVGVW
jgi:hypothetical protein